jgi:hypothetical protein
MEGRCAWKRRSGSRRKGIKLTMAETASRSDDIVNYEVLGDTLSLFIWLRWKSKTYLIF